MKPIPTTVNKIAAHIRFEITNNILKPLQHLKESEFAKKFNVSRVPVREAFRILQSEGYLDVYPNKGSFVGKISKNYIRETGITYKLLAPFVLERAIPKYTEKTYEKADRILNKIEKSRDFSKIGYLTWDFAKTIYSPSKMQFILGIFDEIYMHNIRALNEIYEIKEYVEFKVHTHREFLRLCKKNKTAEAIKLWTEFLDTILDILLAK